MIEYMLYDKTTGRLHDSLCSASRIDLVTAPQGCGFVAGHWPPDTHAVGPDGHVVPITDPPQTWLDQRSTNDDVAMETSHG